MKKIRKRRSDRGKVRKFLSEKKKKVSVSLSKDNYFFVKRLAILCKGNESRVIDGMICRVRLADLDEVRYLIKVKELEIEFLLHGLKKKEINGKK